MKSNLATEREQTVDRHIMELRRLADDGIITSEDHNKVGLILRDHISELIGMSIIAWDTFKRIVDESRKVHYQ